MDCDCLGEHAAQAISIECASGGFYCDEHYSLSTAFLFCSCVQDLRTDGARVATYKGVPLSTSAVACVAPTQANAPIS